MQPSRAEVQELLGRYATSAPRYTSYPTAVDWSGDFDPASYSELLTLSAAEEGPLSVYVHVPYCDERCLFCGCNVVITRNVDRVERYLGNLEREIELVAATGIGRRPVQQLHFGGGTPTHLSAAQLERVMVALGRAFQIDVSTEVDESAEIAIEVDPRVTSREQLVTLGRLGFKRISLGVQDFDPDVQTAIKRVQSESQARDVIDWARAEGFDSVNVDLIYGLPHQTRDSFQDTVTRTLALAPDRVALFHYAHVPWMKKHQRALDMEAAPDTEEKFAIFQDAAASFLEGGYVHIGLDHFARADDELAVALTAGGLQRNFMGYTTLRTGRRGWGLVGLGPSSIGEVGGCYAQNSPAEAEWATALEEGRLPCVRGYRLTAEDELRRDVIMGLMCNLHLKKNAIEADHGIEFDTHFAAELKALAPLEQDGLVQLLADELRVTELGQMFLRNIALPFDAYYSDRVSRGEAARETFSRTL